MTVRTGAKHADVMHVHGVSIADYIVDCVIPPPPLPLNQILVVSSMLQVSISYI